MFRVNDPVEFRPEVLDGVALVANDLYHALWHLVHQTIYGLQRQIVTHILDDCRNDVADSSCFASFL
jgi:hypothetical protein